MNLMKYFNFNYLKENFKKSKAFIIFMLVLFPILNSVSVFTAGGYNIFVSDLESISGLTLFLLYLLPVLLSFSLFGYVFKRKSIDFIGSMPLSRKTIFITNTIGGISVIVLMFLLTSLLIFLSGIINPTIVIPFGVIIDYFVLFTLSYIFMFTISNIAVSVSGNITTSIVVILLLSFLIPTISYYSEYKWFNESNHITYMCEGCNNGITTYGRRYGNDSKYTLPAAYFLLNLNYSDLTLYNTTAIPRTFILSIVYIFLGIYLFNKKEMEICETSFKTFKTHILVKTLTFIPLMFVVSEIIENSTLAGVIFVILILLIYNFVYDLILKKKIEHFLKNTWIFIGTITILFVIISAMPDDKRIVHSEFTKDDIEIMYHAIERDNVEINKSYYDSLLNGIKTYENIDVNYTDEDYVFYQFQLELKNGTKYYVNSLVSNSDYNNLMNDYRKKKNLMKVDLSNNVAVTALEDYILLDKSTTDLVKNNSINSNENFGININVYKYINHELVRESFVSNINQDFNNKVINLVNDKLLNYRDNNDITKNNGTLNLNDSNNNFIGHMNEGTNVFINNLTKKNINYDEKLYILMYNTDDGHFYYITNLDSSLVNKFTRW